MKEARSSKHPSFMKIFSQETSVDLGKVIHSTQQCLLAMLEKSKRSVDNGKTFGARITDLSKAFDFLDHEF